MQRNALKLQWCIKHSGTVVLCNKLRVSTKEELDNVNTPAVTKRHESLCCPLAEFTEERAKMPFCRMQVLSHFRIRMTLLSKYGLALLGAVLHPSYVPFIFQ